MIRYLVLAFLLFISGCISKENNQNSDIKKPAANIVVDSNLPEALVPVKSPPTVQEKAKLAATLEQFSKRSVPEDVSVLTGYLETTPESPWRVAVLTNLGLLHYNAARFSQAIATFNQAWQEGKNIQGLGQDKALVDGALGELVRMHARLGHKEELQKILDEIKGRPLIGSATEHVAGAKEGLWMMKNTPGIAYLCGPKALESISYYFKLKNVDKSTLAAARSSEKGFSLTQVEDLAKKARLNYRKVKRQSGAKWIMPAVVHWKSNHYAALLEEHKGLMHIKDPTFGGDLWISRASLEEEASGYMLIPVKAEELPKGYAPVALAEAEQVYGRGAVSASDPDRTTCRDYKTTSCTNDKNPPPPAPSLPGQAAGMAQYSFHTMLASLNIVDTPIGYRPAVGPAINFTVTYNQRDANQPMSFAYSNLGRKWTFNWLSYIQDNPDPSAEFANVRHYMAGGGVETHTGYNSTDHSFSYQTSSRALLKRTSAGMTPISYTLTWPDGSVEIYSQSDGLTTNGRKVFLTQKCDPQNNCVTLAYDSSMRIVSITDAIGQVTQINYANPSDFKISQVIDPFGRSATFGYNANGQLISITDVIGLTSQFTYSTTIPTTASEATSYDFINSLTTAYGTTTFDYGETLDTIDRWLEATDPKNNKERLEVLFDSSAVVDLTESALPLNMSNDNYYNSQPRSIYRNSFYWNKQTMKAMGANKDYTKAHIIHWLHTGSMKLSGVKESEKHATDSRIWYNYPGQISGSYLFQGVFEGTMEKPSKVGRVLDDGTTQLYQYEYNDFGKITKVIDPLFDPSLSHPGRTTLYDYTADGIDLLTVKQVNNGVNETLAQFGGYTNHLPTTYTDASSKTTTYTWTAFGKIQTITNARNETTTFNYYSDPNQPTKYRRLQSVTNPNGIVSASFDYDAKGRLYQQTNSDGYTLVYSYDNLDRITTITYPDATTESFTYNKLDEATYTDRRGKITTRSYDELRHLISIQDPLGRITQLGWDNGTSPGIKTLTDPKSQTTTWNYDLSGRTIAKIYPDNTHSDEYSYDTAGRLQKKVQKENPADTGRTTAYSYYKDNFLSGIDYDATGTFTPDAQFNYDPNYPRRTEVVGRYTYTYKPVGALGAGQVDVESGLFVDNQPYQISYSYDELGRLSNRKIGNGTTLWSDETSSYDSLGRLTTLQNNLGTFTHVYVGQSSRLQTLTYPNGQHTQYDYHPVADDLNLQKITNFAPGGTVVLSSFEYPGYDKAGNIQQINRAQNGTTQALTYGYDNADRLTTASDVTGPLYEYGYDTADNTLTETRSGSLYRSYTFNNTLNQIDNGTIAFTYDKFGNLSKYNNKEYFYDGADRVNLINNPNINFKSQFTYDPLHRMIQIKESDLTTGAQKNKTDLIWCGLKICARRNINGVVDRLDFAYGEILGSQKHFYTFDHLGSIREMTDNTGQIRAQFNYNPYGIPTKIAGDLDSHFRYTGQFSHVFSGLVLAPYRAYEPSLGRWLNRDPIGERGGVNLYGYVGDNPVNRVDPLGLSAQTQPIPTFPIFTIPIDSPANNTLSNALTHGLDALSDAMHDALDNIYNTDPLDPSGNAGHNTGSRPSTEGKHEEGDARRKRDRGREKGDENRGHPRRRPKGWTGPWPPKPCNN